MKRKKSSPLFKLIKGAVRLFYPKIKVIGTEFLSGEPSVIVCNHAKMNGPIACELYFPGKRKIWCAEEMMHTREVPAYAFQDFWSDKPKYIRWYYRFMSYLIAPAASFIFNHANTIAVYRDRRIVSTLKETARALADGANVIIFPEHHVPHNHIVNDFQTGFVDIACSLPKHTVIPYPNLPRKEYPTNIPETEDFHEKTSC